MPHNFGLGIHFKEGYGCSKTDDIVNIGGIGLPQMEEQAKMRTAIKRKILNLKLGQLVRNEYETQEKEKFLAGHFCCQSSNASSRGDRIQIRKSASIMKEWARKIYSELSVDWPYLKFKVMLQNTVENNDNRNRTKIVDADIISFMTSKEDVRKKILNTFSTYGRADPTRAMRRSDEGADELLIQFETDSQNLPPEGALNRLCDRRSGTGALYDC